MNKKKFLFYLFLSYTLSITKAFALPDQETIQLNLMIARAVVQTGLQLFEEAQTVKREVTDKVNGAKGAISTAKKMSQAVKDGNLDGALSEAENLNSSVEGMGIDMGFSQGGTSSKSKVPSFVSNVNDAKETQKEISKNLTPQYNDYGDKNVVTEEQNLKVDALQRENVANLYANGLATRVALAKEKAATPEEEIDSSDTRQIISATKNIIMKTNQRLAKISEFESAIYEYRLIEKNKQYQTVNNSSQSEETSEENGDEQ